MKAKAREFLQTHFMKSCGLYEAHETGSYAMVDVDQAGILVAICGEFHAECQSRGISGGTAFVMAFAMKLVSAIHQSDPRSTRYIVEISEINKIYDFFKGFRLKTLITTLRVERPFIARYLESYSEKVTFSGSRHQNNIEISQEALRNTFKRLCESGQGGTFSMITTGLLLARLTRCIKDNATLHTTSMPIIASILVKL